MRILAALVAAVVASGTAGCSTTTSLPFTASGGRSGPVTSVLLDGSVAARIAPVFAVYLGRRPGSVQYGVGTPVQIAGSVKDGQRVDAVVVPAGPALDRIRDEFVLPAERIGEVGPTAYWAGAVDMRGWALVTFLTGAVGRRALRAHGVLR